MTSPMPSAQCPVPSDRDLTLTEKAVAMLKLAEAGLLPKFQVVHHACSFDRCSCWCVYSPDGTFFAAIGPSERDRAVANKLVDKMNRDLAQIRARDGERQEAGGKGQEGETVTQTHTGGTPETVPAKAADGDAIADDFAKAEAASLNRDWDGFVTAEVAKPVTVGSVLRKVRAEVLRTTGDEQLAIRVEGAAAAEVSGLFREAENRGLMHLEAEVEWEGFESLSVGVGGVDACGVSRCSSVNLVSVEKVFSLLCDHEVAKSTLKAKVVTP